MADYENIPKTIHYFWFGNNPKPDIVNTCIASWHKFMPDWEIKEWNETNYDVRSCKYVEQAYEAKKWAFVADYARFDILNRYGGMYLDTDVELLKKIPDDYFDSPFTATDNNGLVSPGVIMVFQKQHWLANAMVESYHKSEFNKDSLDINATVNARVNTYLKARGYIVQDAFQQFGGLNIYPSEQFGGYDVNLNEYDITSETIAVHHLAGSWMTKKQLAKRKVRSAVKRLFGVKGYKKLLSIKRKLFGISTK